MTLAEKQLLISTHLASFKNGQDRLAFLVEQAKSRSGGKADIRIRENLIPGCLVKLWLYKNYRNGRCIFECDSDSLVARAIAGMLCEFYNGETPGEILRHEPVFLAHFGITQHLTPNRRNALARVWEAIRGFAAESSGTECGVKSTGLRIVTDTRS